MQTDISTHHSAPKDVISSLVLGVDSTKTVTVSLSKEFTQSINKP